MAWDIFSASIKKPKKLWVQGINPFPKKSNNNKKRSAQFRTRQNLPSPKQLKLNFKRSAPGIIAYDASQGSPSRPNKKLKKPG